MSLSAMRHWFCALSARLASRSDRSLFERTSTKPRMNTTCSAAAWAARISRQHGGGVRLGFDRGRDATAKLVVPFLVGDLIAVARLTIRSVRHRLFPSLSLYGPIPIL